MKLSQLVSELKSANLSEPEKNLDILNLTSDTRQVSAQSLFVAIRGTSRDGHDFLGEAIQKGARVLIVEDATRIPIDFKGPVVQVQSGREALDLLAATFYGFPSSRLFCIGVTGTNGKTSTTYMLEALFNFVQADCAGVMGTIDHHLGKTVWESSMTTPDPVALQKRLKEFVEGGAKVAAMEVSSHALDQKRAESVEFDVGIFTNLTRDHMDYHPTMEHYFGAKEKLFSQLLKKSTKSKKTAFINVDDSYGSKIKVPSAVQKFTLGQKNTDLSFELKKMALTQTEFDFQSPWGKGHVNLPMAGLHNVYNVLGALGAALFYGMSIADCEKALSQFRGVPGRLQSVPNKRQVGVFVDYAHTPDALENVLKSLQKIRHEQGSKGKIITVFGCGGDRDRGKRPLMAQMTEKGSDYAILTSDNPRTEDPQSILQEVEKGFSANYLKSQVKVEVDRKLAILSAIQMASPADLVLIAGKGHEDYQIIGTTKNHFSDYEVALEALK